MQKPRRLMAFRARTRTEATTTRPIARQSSGVSVEKYSGSTVTSTQTALKGAIRLALVKILESKVPARMGLHATLGIMSSRTMCIAEHRTCSVVEPHRIRRISRNKGMVIIASKIEARITSGGPGVQTKDLRTFEIRRRETPPEFALAGSASKVRSAFECTSRRCGHCPHRLVPLFLFCDFYIYQLAAEKCRSTVGQRTAFS